MAQPPRLRQILLNPEQSIIYFVTLCVKERRSVLAKEKILTAIERAIQEIRNWRVLAGVIMPDHLHVVVTPTQDRSLVVSDFATGFKRLLRKTLPAQDWEWQRGGFDRLLRSDESLHNKWIYVEQNPVRAGLVKDVRDWPYYLGSIADQNAVGEAVSLPGRTGKLTASPTGKANRTGKLTASPTGKQII